MKKKSPKRLSVFYSEFREDLAFWVKTNRKIAIKILDIVEAVLKDPFKGIGKPEALRYLGSNVWSRRITQEHRLVYIVKKESIDFIQCRYHY